MTVSRDVARSAVRRSGHFEVLASEDLAARLERFYLDLPFDGRRQRFRAGVSGESIRRYCSAIDPRACFAVCLITDGSLRTVLEVHALGRTFEVAELTACCGQDVECLHVMAHLVQIAAFDAARRGCRRLVVDTGECTTVLSDVLREVGRREPDGLTSFDISDYSVAPDREVTPIDPENGPERPRRAARAASVDLAVAWRAAPA